MRLARIGAMVLLIAGCTGTPAPSGSADSFEESASPTAPATESAGETPATAADGELCAQGREPCPITAGTYMAAPFEPNFSFEIGDGWQNDRAYADGGGISQQAGGIYWMSGVAEGTVGEEPIEIGAGVDDVVAFLQSFEALGMEVSEPTEVTIDGASGQQVDVATNEVMAPGMFNMAEDRFNLAPDEKARFIVVDKDGETVVFIVESFTADGFDDWVETTLPVIDSITWQ